jgi:hypothetical protein
MMQTYYEKNKEKIKARALEYQEKNRKSINAQRRAKYHANKGDPNHYIHKNEAIQQEKRRTLLAELKDFPCMDCGVKYIPAVMEFHHRDPSEKDGTVTKVAYTKMREEAAKCDLLCANCHRIRHHG